MTLTVFGKVLFWLAVVLVIGGLIINSALPKKCTYEEDGDYDEVVR